MVGEVLTGDCVAGEPVAGSCAGLTVPCAGGSCADIRGGGTEAEPVVLARTDSAVSGPALACDVDDGCPIRATVAPGVLVPAVVPIAPRPVATGCTASAPPPEPGVPAVEEADAGRASAAPAMARCGAGTLVRATPEADRDGAAVRLRAADILGVPEEPPEAAASGPEPRG